MALIDNLARKVTELRDAWSPEGGDYLAELTGAGRTSSDFDSLPAALGEVVNRMGYTLENIHVDKLGRPAGVTTGAGAAQPGHVALQALELEHDRHQLPLLAGPVGVEELPHDLPLAIDLEGATVLGLGDQGMPAR